MILIAMHESILLSIGRFLVVRDSVRPADLIHVLGGGYDRLDYGMHLYQQGYAPKLFITGGDDAVKYRKYLLAKGVPPRNLLPSESWATNTFKEALELRSFLETESSVRSVIIVSSPYQSRRARWAFQKVLKGRVSLQFVPVPFGRTSHAEYWWTDSDTRKSVLGEHMKILFYYFRFAFTS